MNLLSEIRSGNWQNYLDFCSNLYAYPYKEKNAIYDRNPNATAVADYNQWRTMGRFVKRGQKGIRINTSKVVFDISQTAGNPINKWAFEKNALPDFCDYLNSKGISETTVSPDEEFSLTLTEYINSAMQSHESISSKLSDEQREFAAASAAYTVCRRLGVGLQMLDYDLNGTSIEQIGSNVAAELVAQAFTMYADRFIAAGRTISIEYQNKVRQQLAAEERAERNEQLAVVLDEIEDVVQNVTENAGEDTVDYIDDGEAFPEDDNEQSKYEAAEVSDEQPYQQTNEPSESTEINNSSPLTEVKSVSEQDFTSLSEERKMQLLDEALSYPTSAIDKERIQTYYSSNIRSDAAIAYTKFAFKNKHHKTENTSYPCIISYSGKNGGLRINYQANENEDSREYFIIDWQTVCEHIRSMVHEGRYVQTENTVSQETKTENKQEDKQENNTEQSTYEDNGQLSLLPKELSKAERKKLEDTIKGLAYSYEHWQDIYENGSSDPFYSDETGLNLTRNHILYYKRILKDEYSDYVKLEDIPYYNEDIPPETGKNYYALKVGDVIDISGAEENNIADGRYTVKAINFGVTNSEDTAELEALDMTVTVKMRDFKRKWHRVGNEPVRKQTENAETITVEIPNSTAHRNFIALNRMFPDFMSKKDSEVSRYSSKADNSLVLRWVGTSSFSLSISTDVNGVIQNDPDILLTVDNEKQAVTSFSYSSPSAARYIEFANENGGSCERFISSLLRSVELNEYTSQRAEGFDNEVKETEIAETTEIKESTVSLDKQTSEGKQYSLQYGLLGNGVTVYNSAVIDKEINDYPIVAHIDTTNRLAVKFHEELPENIKAEIINAALKEDIQLNISDLAELSALAFMNIQSDDGYTVLKEYRYENGKAVLYDMYNNITADLQSTDSAEETVSKDTVSESEPETESPELPFAVGDEIEYLGRTYTVENIEVAKNEIALLDQNTGWFPITNLERLSAVLADYNAQQAQEEIEIAAAAERPENFRITNNELGAGTPKEKYARNVRAIKLLKQLEAEERYAAKEEQEILSNYVGWGGISQAFERNNEKWSKEYSELKELLTPYEYEAAFASVNTAFYTQPAIIRSMYAALESFGFKSGKVLEPACGIGNFIGCAPDSLANNTEFTGIELDVISGKIARYLYPQANIQVCGYEHAKLKENSFDVVIGNVPFGNFSVLDRKYNKQHNLIHDYYFTKSLEMVKPGGIVAFITSKGTMDKESSKVRRTINEKAELVGAVRLPETAFLANAGTEAVADIIFLQKRDLP